MMGPSCMASDSGQVSLLSRTESHFSAPDDLENEQTMTFGANEQIRSGLVYAAQTGAEEVPSTCASSDEHRLD